MTLHPFTPTHKTHRPFLPTGRSLCCHVLTLAFLASFCIRTNAQPIVRKQLMLAQFEARPISKVDIREINLAAGQKGPLHKHPCPVVGYIVAGSIYFQVSGDSAKILHAGDPFYEPANTIIKHFDNASGTEPARFVLNYLMNNEKEFIILLDDTTSP